jgi:hypothetical protein
MFLFFNPYYGNKYEFRGYALRLMVYVSLLNFSYVLDGVPRMRERPIGDLVVGLKQLGANVDCFLGTDCPPVRINGIGGLPGGKVSFMNFHVIRFCTNISLVWRKNKITESSMVQCDHTINLK